MPSITYEWEEVEIEDNENLFFVELEIDFNWTAGNPGCLYGPPERCYPPEPDECDINDITVTKVLEIDEDGNETEHEVTEEVQKFWADKFEEEVAEEEDFYERMCIEGREADEAAYEAAMEDRWEERRELDWL